MLKFRESVISCFACVGLCSILLMDIAMAAQTYSLTYLTIPNGAREIALGNTGVSHARGGVSAWWNPALISSQDSEIDFQVFRWLADSRGSFGGVVLGTEWGGIAGYYFNLGIDNFEARERPGSAQAIFETHHSVFALGTSYDLGRGVGAGLIYKSYLEDIFGDRLSGANVVDLGLSWKRKDLNVGIAFNNIASEVEGFPLPFTIRAGFDYNYRMGDYTWISVLEMSKLRDDDVQLHAGLEAGWRGTIFLRGGMYTTDTEPSGTFGFGINYRLLRVDAAYSPEINNLGSTWRVGLGLKI